MCVDSNFWATRMVLSLFYQKYYTTFFWEYAIQLGILWKYLYLHLNSISPANLNLAVPAHDATHKTFSWKQVGSYLYHFQIAMMTVSNPNNIETCAENNLFYLHWLIKNITSKYKIISGLLSVFSVFMNPNCNWNKLSQITND